MRRFDELDIGEDLKRRIAAGGFETMTEIQEMCIPELLKRRDVIAQSPTGTGKTLGFLAPLLQQIHQDCCWIAGVVIAPTRELSLQTKAVADQLGARCECFIGGVNIEKDHEKMKGSFSIAVGTPGRLLELMNLDRARFSRVSYVVLDEADKLLGFGFEEKLLQIIQMLPKERTTALFSATIDESVNRLSKTSLRSPVRLQANSSTIPVDLELEYIVLRPLDKLAMVLEMVRDKRSILFFATCNQVDFFCALLSRLVPGSISKIHGKMPQEERGKVYAEFMGTEKSTLLCTDVAARGIDFKDVELVVHFDIPKDYNNIVHRSGRTARNGDSGRSVIFIMPNECAYPEFLKLKNISAAMGSATPETIDYGCIRKEISPELLDLSVKAFVSYIRSYKEHIVSYILDYRGLDFNSLAELFFLEKIPNMTELRNVRFERFAMPERSKRPEKRRPRGKKSRKTKRL